MGHKLAPTLHFIWSHLRLFKRVACTTEVFFEVSFMARYYFSLVSSINCSWGIGYLVLHFEEAFIKYFIGPYNISNLCISYDLYGPWDDISKWLLSNPLQTLYAYPMIIVTTFQRGICQTIHRPFPHNSFAYILWSLHTMRLIFKEVFVR